MDITLKNFIKGKSNIIDTEYESNPPVYGQILLDKKQFVKQSLRARQYRRICMILLAKKVLPMDLKEINEVLELYQDEMGWKISKLTDQYEHQRKQEAKTKAALQAKSSEFNPNVNNASVINNSRMK